jgi:hypothetical protein
MKRLLNILFTLAFAVFTLGLHAQDNTTDATDDSTTIERPEIQPIELSDEINNILDQYRNEQGSLRDELRARLDALEEPTASSRRELIEAFRLEHATRIAVQRERSIDIRNAQLQHRRDHVTDRPVRDDLSTAVTDRKALFEQRRAEILEKRHALRSDLESASNEDRLKIIEDFREENLQLLRDQKQLRRQLRDDLRDDLSGDRRPTE